MLQIPTVRRILLMLALVAVPALAHAQPGATTPQSASASGGYTFTWNRVPGATYYYLWVNEGLTPKYTVWYTAAQANCAGSQPTCAVAVTLPPVAFGDHLWWVQTYNAQGYGPWSIGKKWTARTPTAPYVTDANGKFIGTLLSDNIVLIEVNGQPARGVILRTGFQQAVVQLFYTQAACAGSAYTYAVIPDRIDFTTGVANGYLIRGTAITTTSMTTRTIESNGTVGACQADGAMRTMMPVTEINMTTQLGGLVAPFTVIR